ncbi:hypothetical protein ACN4EG_08985 [Alkalinema pantanalense CENA528]
MASTFMTSISISEAMLASAITASTTIAGATRGAKLGIASVQAFQLP